METTTKPANTTVLGTDKTADAKRNPSSTYTIKSMAGLVKKLEQLKMVTPQELEQLKKLHKDIVTRWIGGNLGL